MTYKGVVFSLKSGFKNIVLVLGVDFSLNSGFTKIVLTPGLPLLHLICGAFFRILTRKEMTEVGHVPSGQTQILSVY